MKVIGKDYPIYYGKKNAPNHQPVYIYMFAEYTQGLQWPVIACKGEVHSPTTYTKHKTLGI